MQALSDEMLSKLQPHLSSFCRSVKLSLAIVKGDQGWQPLYFLAEYDHALPDGLFKTLFHTPQFRIISGRMDIDQWHSYYQEIRHGGKFTVSLDGGQNQTVVLAAWHENRPSFVTGLESRQAWNRTWPYVQIDFHGGPNEIESSLWTLMKNAAVTYEVPYSSVSEAVSDILRIKEDRLAFKTGQTVHGSVLLPVFASFDSARYERDEDKLHLAAMVVHHSKVNSKKLFVSARVERREETVERLRKTQLPDARILGPEEDLCRSEWRSLVEAPVTSVRHTTFHLVYEAIEDFPLLIDEDHLRLVPVLTTKSEIERLMTERSDRRRLDHLVKIEKQLLDAKGDDFEEAVSMLLSRMGFDISWESKNRSFDVLAASPNGCLVVECTSDPPSVVMAEELRDQARSYRNRDNPRVLPVLATNQTSWSELESDIDLVNMERQHGEVYFLTRDRLKRVLEELKLESLGRTEKYLRRFEW